MTPAPTHYTLTVTAEQLHLIRDATEACARFMLGQPEDLAFKFALGHIPNKRFYELRDRLRDLGPLVTGHPANTFGAANPEARRVEEGLFLLYQAVRQPLYLDRCAAEGSQPDGWCVLGHDPMPVDGWEMPQVRPGKVSDNG